MDSRQLKNDGRIKKNDGRIKVEDRGLENDGRIRINADNDVSNEASESYSVEDYEGLNSEEDNDEAAAIQKAKVIDYEGRDKQQQKQHQQDHQKEQQKQHQQEHQKGQQKQHQQDQQKEQQNQQTTKDRSGTYWTRFYDGG